MISSFILNIKIFKVFLNFYMLFVFCDIIVCNGWIIVFFENIISKKLKEILRMMLSNVENIELKWLVRIIKLILILKDIYKL